GIEGGRGRRDPGPDGEDGAGGGVNHDPTVDARDGEAVPAALDRDRADGTREAEREAAPRPGQAVELDALTAGDGDRAPVAGERCCADSPESPSRARCARARRESAQRAGAVDG